jgi:hypothetical protein
MGLKLVREGERFKVHFWMDERGHSEVGAYLRDLKNGGKREQEDAVTLTRRLNELARFGPPRLWEHGHPLDEGINELKANNGARVFWFSVPGGVAVCSHGVHKPKSYKAHIDRARAIREQVREELREQEAAENVLRLPVRAEPAKDARKKRDKKK